MPIAALAVFTILAAADPAPADAPPETTPQTPPTTASTTKLVAVLDLKSTPAEAGMALALSTVLTAEIGAIPGYKSISRNEVKAILAHQSDARVSGCESVGCMADIAKLMDAQLVVSGSVERVQDALVLSMTLVDPVGPTIIGRQEATWRGAPDAMVQLVRPYVWKLLGGPEAQNDVGRVEVLAASGASIIVDGKVIGDAPLGGPVEGLGTGVHRVIVSKDGCETHSEDVVVARSETTLVHVDLVEEPFYTRWWFWSLTGGSVLAAGGVAVGAVTWGVADAAAQRPAHIVVSAK